MMSGKILKFVVSWPDMSLSSHLHKDGKVSLNKTEWKGFAPRTCGVSGVHCKRLMGIPGPIPHDVEVTYLPQGHISYLNGTKYDGWRAILPLLSKDGKTYLDTQGQPLPEGQGPMYIAHDPYGEIEFNDFAFGQPVSEETISSAS